MKMNTILCMLKIEMIPVVIQRMMDSNVPFNCYSHGHVD